MEITLPYGRHGLPVTIPDENLRHVLSLPRLPALADPQSAVAEALTSPLGTPPLAELARGRGQAVIVVSDLTRPVPNALLLPPILQTLAAAGLPPSQVTILIATGLHRANTADELTEMLSAEVLASGCRVINHDARDRRGQTDCGITARGIPVQINRHYAEADLRILTGLIEPHLMAGYSGGRKAICPGICGADTIMAWHSPPLLAAPGAREGNLQQNPVHEEALAIARLAGGADLIVNVVMNERREVTGVVAGEMEAAHAAGVELADRQARVTIPAPVDIVLTTAAGYPLDLTFYQGVKGLAAARPIVRQGGIIIIAQENAEGIGSPEFTELMLKYQSLESFMADALGETAVSREAANLTPCSASADQSADCAAVSGRIDQWQMQKLAEVCRHARVFNVSSGLPPEVQAQLFVTPCPTVEAALTEALQQSGPQSTLAVIPQGPYVLATLSPPQTGGGCCGPFRLWG